MPGCLLVLAVTAVATGSLGLLAGGPPFRSAFLDVAGSAEMLAWTAADWGAEFEAISRAGIPEIIFPGVVDAARDGMTPAGTIFYKSAAAARPGVPVLLDGLVAHPDLLGLLLDAAAGHNVSVVLGLIRSEYSAVPGDRVSIGNVTAASIVVLRELGEMYAGNPALSGIYLPQELANGRCTIGKPTDCTVCCANCTCCFSPEGNRKQLVSSYLGPLSRLAKRLNPRWRVWIAPDFYLEKACPPLWASCNSRCAGGPSPDQRLHSWCGQPPGTFLSPTEWAEWWRRTLADVPELDVIAHQDGIGNHNSLGNASVILAALRKVVDEAEPPRELWSDLEAFDLPALPAPAGFSYVVEAVSPWWRISDQLEVERPFLDGFTVWEWHKYFSPIGGPQVADPRDNTLNSNASLHNFIELVRRLDHGVSVAPLQRLSLDARYTVEPAATASPGHLTDGLPLWNTGGPLPNYQVRWSAAALEDRPAAGSMRVKVGLEFGGSAEVCSAKAFVLRDTASSIDLPLNATVSIAGVVHTLAPTTKNDNAVNVMYVLLPDEACTTAGFIEFELSSRHGLGMAICEVEAWGHRHHKDATSVACDRDGVLCD